MPAEPFCVLIQEYGCILLFSVLLAGIIGFPIPDEGVLLFAGALVARGNMQAFPALATTILAVQLGSLINYWIAACFWKKKDKHLTVLNCKWKRIGHFMYRFGVWAVPLSYFVPGLRLGLSYGAGILRIPIRIYLISSLTGVVVWVSLYLWLGFLAGSQF